MKFFRSSFVFFICAALAGCGSDGLDDLREFVKSAHADKKPRVEPLPEIRTMETFVYSASDKTDPFMELNLKPPVTKTAGSGGPDPTRRKEALEEYPLDALKMVGTLFRGKQAWAVIMAPDGTVHRAQIGNHLGQNFGQITRISEEKVEVIELIQGSMGDWVEREAGIALVE